jgi:GxxExxY protein
VTIRVTRVPDEGTALQGRSFSTDRFLHGDSSRAGKGHDEIIYKDALVIKLTRAGVPFSREKNYEITYKEVILPHYYYADFVVWDKILFEAKTVEKLTNSHIKQVLNYLAASRLRGGLLVNFGGNSSEWKRVVL